MKKIAITLLMLTGVLGGMQVFSQEKPNIVYLLVDNWGWGDLSIQGSTIQTPNIDDFASQ